MRLGRVLGSGEFLPLNGAAVHPLRVDPSSPDWIPPIVGCEPFWTETMSGVGVQTDLLSLFGLRSTRDGLIQLGIGSRHSFSLSPCGSRVVTEWMRNRGNPATFSNSAR